ncbi:MAG: hypothetical protein IJR99_10455 [Kiritimatiellae bacterium]|nr:hypothetical protein [Kiritimatiellia bacterium]
MKGELLNFFDAFGMMPAGNYPDWGGGPAWSPYLEIPTKGNCWRYACNDPAVNGEQARVNPPETPPNIDCKSIMRGVTDISGAQTGEKEKPCPKCHYKVLLVTRPHYDYHWYRQDDDGRWSHKRGDMSVITWVDDPEKNAKNYHYDTRCGYLCFPDTGLDADKTKK